MGLVSIKKKKFNESCHSGANPRDQKQQKDTGCCTKRVGEYLKKKISDESCHSGANLRDTKGKSKMKAFFGNLKKDAPCTNPHGLQRRRDR